MAACPPIVSCSSVVATAAVSVAAVHNTQPITKQTNLQEILESWQRPESKFHSKIIFCSEKIYKYCNKNTNNHTRVLVNTRRYGFL